MADNNTANNAFTPVSHCIPECHVDGTCNCPNEQPFRFIVEGEEMLIHPSRITLAISPVLYSIIHGGMRESIERCAILEDVNPETFEEFRRFACTGRYWTETAGQRNPQHYGLYYEKCHGLEEAFCRYCRRPLNTTGNGWAFFPHCTAGCSLRQRECPRSQGCKEELAVRGKYKDDMEALCRACRARQKKILFAGETLTPKAALGPAGGQVLTPSIGQSYLMYHARVSVFCDMRLVNDLNALPLRMLHRELRTVNVSGHGNHMADILELIRYVYENTMALDSSRDPPSELTLRYLVSSFVRHYINELMAYNDFCKMMAEFPEIQGECLYGGGG